MRDGRFAKRPYNGVLAELGSRWGLVVGAAPLSAPLDTGFRRYDDGGCSGRQVLWVAEAEVPASAGRAIRESPLRRSAGEYGDAMGDGGATAPRLAPLDTGFRRFDDGAVRAGK